MLSSTKGWFELITVCREHVDTWQLDSRLKISHKVLAKTIDKDNETAIKIRAFRFSTNCLTITLNGK